MSSNIYDNDCSIIKQPVTIDEFRKEIDLLKEEIANLKKAKTDFIIDLVDFDKEDKEIEEKNRELLLYLKSLIETEDFKDNSEIKIKYESNVIMYEKIRDLIINFEKERERTIFNPNTELLRYLKRRNLSLMYPCRGGQLMGGFKWSLNSEGNLDFILTKYHRYNNFSSRMNYLDL
jgi:hypothetical protein